LSCSEAISSFTNLAFSVKASCLCYSSSSFAPFVYDGYQDQCLVYLSTASSSFYSYLGGDQVPRAPCADVGNVASGPVAPTTTASASPSGSSSNNSPASSTMSSSPALTSSIASVISSAGLITTVATTVSSSDAVAFLCRPVHASLVAMLGTLLHLVIS
jgi:hypothetical protein